VALTLAEGPRPSLDALRPGRLFGLLKELPLLVLLGGIVAYLVLSPLVYLIWQGLTTGDGLGLGNIVAAFTVPGTGAMLWNSTVFTVGSAAVSMVTGTALAFFCCRTNAPLKPLLYASSLIPLIVPGILFTISWVFLLGGRAGAINSGLREVGLGFLTMDVFSMGGMILVEGLHLSPIVFLLLFAAFRGADPSLEEAAAMSGAGIGRTLRSITLPLVRPALLGALVVMMVRGLGAFEAPAILGIPDGKYVLTSQIYRSLHTYPVRYDLAGIYSISLMLITALGLFAIQRINKNSDRFATITGKGYRPRAFELGAWRWPVSIGFTLYFLVAVVSPVAILLWTSLLPYYQVPTIDALSSVTLSNYVDVTKIDDVRSSLRNSVVLSVGSATTLMLLMSVVAWLILRTKLRGRGMLELLSGVPLAFPGLVLGVALIFIYIRSPLPIYGTLLILFIAYVTSYMPYAMQYARSSVGQISSELEEAGRMSGAGLGSVLRRITLPLMMPGITAGWIYVVIVSVRELSSSILLYSHSTTVFSVTIWDLWQAGQTNELAAVGVVMILGLMVLVAAAYRLGAKIGIRE
jgi:iron(III) transport system permease protein